MGTALKRVGQLGLLASDLATARVQARGNGRDRVIRRIVERLGTMHGLPQKIGQLLAFSEIDGSDAQFGRLTECNGTWEADEVFETIETALRRPIRSMFQSLESKGVSASIGQVHRGVLKNGRQVAVKVQHPGIKENLGIDVRAVGWLAAPASKIKKGFDPAAFHEEIRRTVMAELDFTLEADAMDEMRLHASRIPELRIPEVERSMSTPAILTTGWLEGERIQEALHWPLPDRQKASELILKTFLRGVFEWHFYHADPHPGNYRFIRTNSGIQIGLLDFGCVKRTTQDFCAGLGALIDAGRSCCDDEGVILGHFLEMGFDERLLQKMASKLPGIAAVLARPIRTTGAFNTSEWSPGRQIAELLGADRMGFRMAGPPDLLFFLRTFQGVLHYLSLLAAPIQWTGIWDSLAKPTIAKAGSERIRVNGPDTAKALRIRVADGDQIKVDLEFDPLAARNLTMLIPGEVQSSLRRKSINLQAIENQATSNPLHPGELFIHSEEQRTVRVWLE